MTLERKRSEKGGITHRRRKDLSESANYLKILDVKEENVIA